jgi:hypothetical protein
MTAQLLRVCIGELVEFPLQRLLQTYTYGKVDMDAQCFLELTCQDLTFGEFGEPRPWLDPSMGIVSETQFDVYDLEHADEKTLMAVLTPIYRILRVRAWVLAGRHHVEGFENIPMKLPRKPGGHSRYKDLFQLTCGFWTRVCHAWFTYVNGVKYPSELICFTHKGWRARYIWINIVNPDDEEYTEEMSWASIYASSFVSSEKRTVSLYLDKDEWCISLETNCVSLTCPGEAGLHFKQINNPPFVKLVGGDTSAIYFVMLTVDHAFAGFYLNDAGTLKVYPLHFHEDEELEGALPRRPSSPHPKCSICFFTDVELERAGNGKLYCSAKCRRTDAA